MLHRIAAFTLAIALVTAPAHAEKLRVVASFSILGDMVNQVAGDKATVTTIVGPNANAHVYTPSVSNARAVTEADVVFVNGLGFETWSKTLIENSGTKAKVYVATDGIKALKVDGATDPDAWHSLTNGIIYVRNFAKSISTVGSANAVAYKANADTYIKSLQSLHDRTTKELADLPEIRRTVVTAHDAFGYLADAYGMRFLAPIGIDTEAEPSAKQLADLIKHLNKEEVAGFFVENITSPALVKQIARETGLSVGGRLFSDALSAKGGPAPNYFSMFEHNLGLILASLRGKS